MNDRQWYYAIDGVQQGPVAEPELVQMIEEGKLDTDVLVWAEGMQGWEVATTVVGLIQNGTGIESIAASSLEILRYAGFWKRFAAVIIDGIILQILSTILTHIAGAFFVSIFSAVGMDEVEVQVVNFLLIVVVYIAFDCLYYTGMESSPKQATLGKMALGIKVTDMDGQRISFVRANVRYWGKIVSMLPLGIGFMMAGFTAQKQALHDILAGTLVVNK